MVELRDAKQGSSPKLVSLPDADVYLKLMPAGTVVTSSKTRTNPHGYFIIPRQLQGRYQICYEKNGFGLRCDDQILTIESEARVLTHFLTFFPSEALIGRTFLQDGSVAFRETYAFGTLVSTKVSLVAPGGAPLGAVNANSYGIFVFPKIPAPGTYQLNGQCSLGVGTASAVVGSRDLNGATLYKLVLADRAPSILRMVAEIGGSPVRTAHPGDTITVDVKAEDPDGDTLHWNWSASNAGFVSTDSPTVSWTLPNVAATNTILVEVRDDKGGYASRSLAIQTGERAALFSGKVIDRATHAPISGATITVAGKRTATNAAGVFQVVVAEAPRYVLNVEKEKFALLSRAYYSGAASLLLEMDAAQRRTLDSRQGGKIIWEGKRGTASLTMRPGTLVDARGAAVGGPVNVDIFSYDLTASNPIPGDLSATTTDGKDARLETFGALDLKITDGGGNPLQLAPGAGADISINIDPTLAASAPPTIPLLTYDKATGYWRQETDRLTRVGNTYVGTVRHFSTFNADTVFTNTACIRMTVADTPPQADAGGHPRFAPAFPFTLHIDYTDSGGPRHNDFNVTDPINALLRLPPNVDLQLSIVTASGPARTFTVNSGNAVPDGVSFPPPFDYGVCNGFDLNNLLTGHPVVLAVDLPDHDVPYLGVPGTPNNDTEATAYYKTIGALDLSGNPTVDRGTFAAWKSTNGLSADPNTPAVGEVVGVYFNNGDLQLGRDMHCKCSTTPCAPTSDAACYVTNYGDSLIGGPQGDPNVALFAAVHRLGPLASVAMEYRQGVANPVRFFVFNAAGSLLKSVALDSEGPKFVPHLCLACHGGSYDAGPAHDAIGANFLPFDVFSFLYDPLGVKSLAAQQESFRQLNSIMKGLRSNPADAIGSLVDGWYPCGVNTAGCNATDTPFTPGGWSGNPGLYQTITRPYCRGCHIAQPSYLDWTALSQWSPPSFIQSVICNDPRLMPHAEVPFKKFWLSQSPHAASYMTANFSGFGSCPP